MTTNYEKIKAAIDARAEMERALYAAKAALEETATAVMQAHEEAWKLARAACNDCDGPDDYFSGDYLLDVRPAEGPGFVATLGRGDVQHSRRTYSFHMEGSETTPEGLLERKRALYCEFVQSIKGSQKEALESDLQEIARLEARLEDFREAVAKRGE